MTNEELELLSTEDLITELLRRKNWAGVFIRTTEECKTIVGKTLMVDKWTMDYRNMNADWVMKLLADWIVLTDLNRHTETTGY